MKKSIKLLALSILSSCAVSCTSTANQGFTVDFQLDEIPDCSFFVSEKVPNPGSWFKDTLELKDGKATYKGKVDCPRLTNFYFAKGQYIYGTIEVFLDNSKNIKITGKDVKEAVVTGCKTNDEYQTLYESLAPYLDNLKKISAKTSAAFRENEDASVIDNLKEEKKLAQLKMLEYLLQTPGYANSEICPYIVYSHFMNSTEMLDMALDKVDPSLKDNVYIKELSDELSRQKRVAIGKQAYNFCMKDIHGKEYKLEDYRGKYVLVEFSSSWCGWCKKEIPFLKKVYEEHKGNKDFVMLTINMDDIKEKWVEDVEKENLPWPVISDLQAFKGETAQAFNIHGIPMIFLIDKEGKILQKELRGEDMVLKVKETLKK